MFAPGIPCGAPLDPWKRAGHRERRFAGSCLYRQLVGRVRRRFAGGLLRCCFHLAPSNNSTDASARAHSPQKVLPEPGGDCPNVANRPAPHAHPPAECRRDRGAAEDSGAAIQMKSVGLLGTSSPASTILAGSSGLRVSFLRRNGLASNFKMSIACMCRPNVRNSL